MTSHKSAKTVVRALVGVVVLLVAGAADASSTAGGSAASSEIQRLQATWGTKVVRSAQVIPNSQLILIGTRDRALIASANPQRWLGSKFPVVVMYVSPSGAFSSDPTEKCGFEHSTMSDESEMSLRVSADSRHLGF
jgi:hypothetical protein